MSFYARDFIFDGKMSQELGLTITSEGAESSTEAGSGVSPIIQKIYRRPRNYLLGVDQAPVMSFPVSFNSENKINAVMASKIGLALFGKMGYKKLQVIQPDMTGYYWNCFLENPQIKRVGGEIVGWNATVMCDSPWAYSFPRTTSYPSSTTTYTSALSNLLVTYNNRSGNNDYSYPTVVFTMASSGGYFYLENRTDNQRYFIFTSLLSNEIVTVDNDLQIITSSTYLRRLSNFNKNFFRLLPGKNDLYLSGNISKLQIIQTDAQKIGG